MTTFLRINGYRSEFALNRHVLLLLVLIVTFIAKYDIGARKNDYRII